MWWDQTVMDRNLPGEGSTQRTAVDFMTACAGIAIAKPLRCVQSGCMVDAMHSLLVAILLAFNATQVDAALGRQSTPARRLAVTNLIIRHAQAVHMDPVLVAAIVSVENPRLTPGAQNKSNVGIMQVHKGWLRRTDWQRACGDDLTDIDTNVCFGVRVLQAHLEEHDSTEDGLLAYNGCKSTKCRSYATRVMSRADAARSR
jgi:soluble lytic murein transglycosylase-like protein